MINIKKVGYIASLTIVAALLTISSGCTTKQAAPERYLSFEQQLETPNKVLEKQSRLRTDKFYYGQGRAGLIFPVYFPLALPDGLEYQSFKVTPADFEGEIGQLIINYTRNKIDTLTVFQGYGESDITKTTYKERVNFQDSKFDNTQIVVGYDKPNAYYEEKASGYAYLIFGGGTEGFSGDEPVYMLKAKGLTKQEMIGMVSKMVEYE